MDEKLTNDVLVVSLPRPRSSVLRCGHPCVHYRTITTHATHYGHYLNYCLKMPMQPPEGAIASPSVAGRLRSLVAVLKVRRIGDLTVDYEPRSFHLE